MTQAATTRSLHVALDAPSGLAEWVMTQRRAWSEVARPDLPPMLGAMGPLANTEPESWLTQRLAEVAASQPRLDVRFDALLRFLDTPMVYLRPSNSFGLDALNARLREAGIHQAETLFSTIHHMAIAWFDEHADDAIKQALGVEPPPAEFRFDRLSLYSVSGDTARRLWSSPLVGSDDG